MVNALREGTYNMFVSGSTAAPDQLPPPLALGRARGTTVIVVSGHSDQGEAQNLLSHGAFDYLLKPFRLEIVEESVKRAIEAGRTGF